MLTLMFWCIPKQSQAKVQAVRSHKFAGLLFLKMNGAYCIVLRDYNMVQDSALQNIIVVFARVADVSVYLVAVHHALIQYINFHKVI